WDERLRGAGVGDGAARSVEPVPGPRYALHTAGAVVLYPAQIRGVPGNEARLLRQGLYGPDADESRSTRRSVRSQYHPADGDRGYRMVCRRQRGAAEVRLA